MLTASPPTLSDSALQMSLEAAGSHRSLGLLHPLSDPPGFENEMVIVLRELEVGSAQSQRKDMSSQRPCAG